MDKINDGGPAFPHTHIIGINGMLHDAQSVGGMSLRAYFAGQAMQATIPANYHMSAVGTRWLDPGTAAKEAVDAADALIAALEVKHE